MFRWFGAFGCKPLFLDHSEHISVHMACADLAKDVHGASGQRMLIKPYLPMPADEGGVVVGSLENPAFAKWAAAYINVNELTQEWEGYRIAASENLLVVAGSDRRGALHGVYHLSQHFLGIDPCYLFTGKTPAHQAELAVEDGVFGGAPKTYRFRGWFLNDEDLLSDWKDGGGARHIDYPVYDQVVHPDALMMVLETAARLGINLMIPASFVDINNPPEENLIRMCVNRGFYVTQHHVEPLGVSHFGFENYWRERGSEEQFSFVTNRERVVECWRNSVRKWAKYEGVIWQLGLRGRGDVPAWHNDKAIDDSDEAHGALISEALQVQYDLVREELGHEDFLSTATLWLEGSELFHKGCLKFPRSTIIVFADAGPSQMFGNDFFKLDRMPEYRYGLYYHVAFWGHGPHLVQGTDLRKMQYQYRLAAEKGDTFYSILNVTNVRDVVMCVQANAELVWELEQFEENEFLNRYFLDHFGLMNGAERMHEHFMAFADYPHSKGKIQWYDAMWLDALTEEAELDFKKKVILDGAARGYGSKCLNDPYREKEDDRNDADWCAALAQGIEDFEASYAALADAYRQVKPEGKTFFRDLMLVQEEIMLGLYEWARSCGRMRIALDGGDKSAAVRELRHAVFAMEKLLEDRRKAEHAPFEDWYRGDRKMALPNALARTRALLEQMKGE